MIRVAIISPTAAIRAGLSSLLEDDPRLDIIGEAPSLDDLEIELREAEVVVWSPNAGIDEEVISTELARQDSLAPAAFLLVSDDPNLARKLSRLKGHAWGLLPTEASQAELIAAVEALSEGLVVLSPGGLTQLTDRRVINGDVSQGMVETLTGRELEILQLMALGLTNKQIAARLRISAHTVKFHVSTIFGKMGTTNRTETVKSGLKNGLITL